MRIVVEKSAPEAESVARLLAAEGHDVRVADLDADSGPADVAYLDVWTPETAPRVSALRERGARITCSSELVLTRARQAGARTVGITGTAGKSTTASLAVQLLHGRRRLRPTRRGMPGSAICGLPTISSPISTCSQPAMSWCSS